jgi:hypothetical protein
MVFWSKVSSVRSSHRYLTVYCLARKIETRNMYFQNFKKLARAREQWEIFAAWIPVPQISPKNFNVFLQDINKRKNTKYYLIYVCSAGQNKTPHHVFRKIYITERRHARWQGLAGAGSGLAGRAVVASDGGVTRSAERAWRRGESGSWKLCWVEVLVSGALGQVGIDHFFSFGRELGRMTTLDALLVPPWYGVISAVVVFKFGKGGVHQSRRLK